MTEKESSKGWRSVYLPGPDHWFRFNLSCHGLESEEGEDFLGYALDASIPGGSRLRVEARIQPNVCNLSRITPMYIREGTASKVFSSGC